MSSSGARMGMMSTLSIDDTNKCHAVHLDDTSINTTIMHDLKEVAVNPECIFNDLSASLCSKSSDAKCWEYAQNGGLNGNMHPSMSYVGSCDPTTKTRLQPELSTIGRETDALVPVRCGCLGLSVSITCEPCCTEKGVCPNQPSSAFNRSEKGVCPNQPSSAVNKSKLDHIRQAIPPRTKLKKYILLSIWNVKCVQQDHVRVAPHEDLTQCNARCTLLHDCFNLRCLSSMHQHHMHDMAQCEPGSNNNHSAACTPTGRQETPHQHTVRLTRRYAWSTRKGGKDEDHLKMQCCEMNLFASLKRNNVPGCRYRPPKPVPRGCKLE